MGGSLGWTRDIGATINNLAVLGCSTRRRHPRVLACTSPCTCNVRALRHANERDGDANEGRDAFGWFRWPAAAISDMGPTWPNGASGRPLARARFRFGSGFFGVGGFVSSYGTVQRVWSDSLSAPRRSHLPRTGRHFQVDRAGCSTQTSGINALEGGKYL